MTGLVAASNGLFAEKTRSILEWLPLLWGDDGPAATHRKARIIGRGGDMQALGGMHAQGLQRVHVL